MFFISKTVASGIKALRERDHVARELDAIRAMPGFEVYVNAIAEGLKEGAVRTDRRRKASKTTDETKADGKL